MAQTKIGAAKAMETIRRKYGEDFHQMIGSMGGKAGVGPEYQKGGSTPSGFAANIEMARIAGTKGGRISRRRK